jgi:hypothetical protein
MLMTVSMPFIDATFETPVAARGIYEQQFQMRRFATEFFPRRVAVNDIGLVSYKNDTYVLDLFGLGSEPVREAKTTGAFNKAFVDDISTRKNIDYAMIYNKWFQDSIPDSWCLMATLRNTDVVTAGGSQVAFYALRPDIIDDMREAMTRFEATLPKRVSIIPSKMPCATPGSAIRAG